MAGESKFLRKTRLDDPWRDIDAHFDRREGLRLSLQTLEAAFRLGMAQSPNEEDLAWYQEEVRKIFVQTLARRQK